MRRASRGAPPSAPAAFHAPLFQELVTGLDETERHVVLDLGAASTAMLALLGQSRSRVEIVDLAYFGGIELLNSTEPGDPLVESVGSMLPKHRPDDAFDLVFCWDLPNYLTINALSALMREIGQRACPGAVAHALIYYSERDMPERPGRFLPTADGELVDFNTSRAAIPAPRYSPEDLDKGMGRFVLDRARLLGNGMQEFLFRL